MSGERHLFGTDGIRGVANEHPMTPELALKLGRAVTFVAGRGLSHAPRIVIGKDTRLSGYMIETAIASGICSMGGRVMLCGPIPTPAKPLSPNARQPHRKHEPVRSGQSIGKGSGVMKPKPTSPFMIVSDPASIENSVDPSSTANT